MAELARVVTTDAAIDAAIQQAALYQKLHRRVAAATYAAKADALKLRLEDGVAYTIPRRLLQGLRDAKPEVVAEIELLGNGTGLYWPALDVAHSAPALLAGIFGSAKWMDSLRMESIHSRIPA